MASFTFDPEELGSVIDIPHRIERSTIPPNARGPQPSGRVVADGTSSWRAGMGGALEAIDSEVVEKVVLTRQVDLEFSSDIITEALTDRLRASEPDSYTFSIGGLVGASPELLVSLREGRVSSLALAGTSHETEGLATDKMDREHDLSRSSVEEGISPYVDSLSIQARTIRNYGDIKHLATQFDGRATPGVTVLDVLASLHPTAAVAGTPTDTAMKVIIDLEPRSRGRYAGPVGWFNTEGEGEFAIALRCGLINGNKGTLFAGGGIVRGSLLDAEYAETELKLQPMLRALGVK